MRGNSHVRFSGEGMAARSSPYPTVSAIRCFCAIAARGTVGEDVRSKIQGPASL